MKKLISIFTATKPKPTYVKPQIKVRTVVPEGYTGDMRHFNDTFLNIQAESFKAYERLRQN